MYFAMQALTGQNGIIQKFMGNGSNSNSAAPSPAVSTGDVALDADGSRTATDRLDLEQRIAGSNQPKANPDLLAQQAWPHGAPADLYVILSTAPPATAQDLASQFSTISPNGAGPEAADAKIEIPWNDYSSTLLDDGLRDAALASLNNAPDAIISPQQGSRLPAVRWPQVDLTNATLNLRAHLDIASVPEEVRTQNHTIWADIFLTLRGVSPDPASATYRADHVFHSRKLLSKLMPAKKKVIERKLFNKDEKEAEAVRLAEEEEARRAALQGPVTWWHPHTKLMLVQQVPNTVLPIGKLPPALSQYLHPIPEAETWRANHMLTYPVIFPNDFWQLREHMITLNASTATLPLEIEVYTSTWFKYQLLAAFSDSMDKQAGAGLAGAEIDMLKTSLLETSPWLLGLTLVVSLLHSLFEFLAFSSDVRHWKNKENMAGVSVGSILTNVIVQLVILLYLLDSREDTSWTILLGQGVGMVIEAWKLTKAVTVAIIRTPPTEKTLWRLLPYKLDIRDKHVLSEEEKETQVYDRLAFKYVGIAMAPVLTGYTIYSALYQSHKSWYSFIIGTLTSFTYAFGFVTLVPQLIVNHKLRSTAGLSAKTMIYSTLGTVVDDLGAFCIKMPTLHRLACFRDDVVFIIFLYQKWLYGTDNTRSNQYGQVVDREGREKKEKEKELRAKGEKVDTGTKKDQ